MQFLYRTLFVVPMVIPGLVVALIWRSFFFESTQGYLNAFLDATHLMGLLQWLDATLHWGGIFAPGRPPAWLGDPRLILTACVVWGFPWVGSFAVLTHLAKLQAISRDIYEAADIDGATWFSKFTRIELPLILGSIYILLVFVVIDTIKDAGMILALAGIEGGPGGKVTVPALFMLRKAFVEQSMGYACAVGLILTLVVVGLQKLSAGLLEWKTLSATRQLGLRAAVVLFAGLMLASGLLWNGVLLIMIMPTIANLIPLFRLLGDMNLLNTLSALVLVGAATGQVFAIFVLRNFVAEIPHDLFEAAEMDGASHFQQMMIIVVPLSGPILSTIGVMTFLTNWNDFVLPLIVMRDHLRLPVVVALLRLSGEYIKFWGPLMAGYALASQKGEGWSATNATGTSQRRLSTSVIPKFLFAIKCSFLLALTYLLRVYFGERAGSPPTLLTLP